MSFQWISEAVYLILFLGEVFSEMRPTYQWWGPDLRAFRVNILISPKTRRWGKNTGTREVMVVCSVHYAGADTSLVAGVAAYVSLVHIFSLILTPTLWNAQSYWPHFFLGKTADFRRLSKCVMVTELKETVLYHQAKSPWLHKSCSSTLLYSRPFPVSVLSMVLLMRGCQLEISAVNYRPQWFFLLP